MAAFTAVFPGVDQSLSSTIAVVAWQSIGRSVISPDDDVSLSAVCSVTPWSSIDHVVLYPGNDGCFAIPGIPPVNVVGETAQVSTSAPVGNLAIFWAVGATAQVSVWAPTSLLSLVGDTAQVSVLAPEGAVAIIESVSVAGETAQVTASTSVGIVSITTPTGGNFSLRASVGTTPGNATLAIPSSTQVGDLLLVGAGYYDANLNHILNITSPSGFTQLLGFSGDYSGFPDYNKVWWKLAEAGDLNSNVAIQPPYSASYGGAALLVFENGAINGSNYTSGSSTTITTGALTPTTPVETWAVVFASQMSDPKPTFTDPSGFTREVSADSTTHYSYAAWFSDASYAPFVEISSVSIASDAGSDITNAGILIGVSAAVIPICSVVGVTAQVSVSNADGSVTGSAYWCIAGVTALVSMYASSSNFSLLLAGITAQVDIPAPPGGRVGILTVTRITIEGDAVPISTTTGSLPSATELADGTPYVLLPGGALSVASSGLWVAVVGGLHTPTSGADTYGVVGAVVADDDYVYAKTSTGWKRSPITTWS